jgi:hypothetical protein
MGTITSLYPDLPQFVIECLALYNQRLKAKAAVHLQELEVCKDVVGIITGYICCPDEMLKRDYTNGPFEFDDIIRDAIPTNTKLAPLLPDFIECFHRITAPGNTFMKSNIAPSTDDVAFARYTCLNSDMLHDYNHHPWERAPLPVLAHRCALQRQSMYLAASLTPIKSDGTVQASGIVREIFGSFETSKQRKSAEAFPFFVEILRLWSNDWVLFDMDDAVAIVGLHTEYNTGQKDKAWKLFQRVTPAKKAAWVAAWRDDKVHSVYLRFRYLLAVEDVNWLVKMVKDFTVETAADWPKLNQTKEKRKASSVVSGQGKKAKKVVCDSDDEFQ